MDRRPTQANPGKGCYWTLIAGTEHIFIENLTEESSHNRKHNDIGLTAELSIGKRRGACFYNDYVTPSPHLELPNTYLDTPPQTPTTPTTFKMVKMEPKTDPISFSEDSDNDSGVDVSTKYIHRSHSRKKARTTPPKIMTPSIQQHSMTPSFHSNDMNQWLVEQSFMNHALMDELNYQNSLLSPTLMPDFHQPPSYPYMNNTSPLLPNNTNNRYPITIHLNNQHQQPADMAPVHDHFMFLNNENNVYPNFNTVMPPSEENNPLQFINHSPFVSMQDYFYL